jgi:peptide chain release factor subunit 1
LISRGKPGRDPRPGVAAEMPVPRGAGRALAISKSVKMVVSTVAGRGKWVTKMESDRFRQLLDTPGPFVSVYFADPEDTDDVGAQLDLNWRVLREQLEQQGADESVIAEIGYAVVELRPPIGRGGRAVIACAAGVVLNEHLLRPAAKPVVRVSELPYIVPILEHGFEHSHYLLVVVDPTGTFITTHADVTRRSETVEAFDGDLKLRAVADRVTELVHDASFDSVFVVGDVGSRSDLLAALPERVRERATSLPIDVRPGGYDFEEIQRAVDATLLRQRLSVTDSAAERFNAEVGRRSGLAAEGLGAVCSALRQGNVDTLIVGDIGDATVVADEGLTTAAPTVDVLSERGATTARTLRADEALPLLAISVGASVVRADERIAPADGIAAVLRYANARRTAVAEGFEPPDGFSRLSLSRRVH